MPENDLGQILPRFHIKSDFSMTDEIGHFVYRTFSDISHEKLIVDHEYILRGNAK